MCPFGGLMAESTESKEQQFKYNGKEFEPMSGINLYDYGARDGSFKGTGELKPGTKGFDYRTLMDVIKSYF